MNNKVIYDHNGAVIKSIPNLDPYFFVPTAASNNITTHEIEEKPYQYHPWIYAVCRVITFNLMHLDRYLYKIQKEEKPIIEHPILDVLNNPNPYMTHTGFWQAILLGLLLPAKCGFGSESLGGQIFIVGVTNRNKPVNFRRGDIPAQLYPYTEKYFKKKVQENPYRLVGWTYEPTKKEKIFYKPEEIIRINLYNPYDWFKGIPAYQPAQIAMIQDISSSIYNTMFFANDATVSGVLTTDEHLTEDMMRLYYAKWMQNHGGPGNANKTAILGSGLKYQQYGLKHADMQYIEQKDKILEQILAVFGLNKIAVGMYENINLATIREGRKILWQDTYIPLDKIILNALNNQWIKFIDKNLRIKTDFSQIAALQSDYSMRAKSAAIMVKDMDFPAALAARITNIPLTEQNLKDYPWLNEKPIKKQSPFDNQEPEKIVPKYIKKELNTDNKMTQEEKIQRSWDYIHKILDPGEKRLLNILHRFFYSQRNRMQDKVDEWLRKQPKAMTLFKLLILDPGQFALDKIQENEKLITLLRPFVKEQLQREENRLENELGGLIEWQVTDETIQRFIDARKIEINEINTTTFKKAHDKIGKAIEEAIKENDNPQQAAKKIKSAISEVGEVRKNQSTTIARTEVGIISSSARFEAYRVEGIEYVQWLTAADEKVVRKAHVIAGESPPIKYGQNFPGTYMRYPLDPQGSVDNIVNCRCVLIAAE